LTGTETVILAGLIAGSLDLTATGLLMRSQGVPFQKLLQTIAGGAIGPMAYEQGSRSVLLGLFFHFLIALTATAVYFSITQVLPFPNQHPILAGTLFGMAVHFFMSLIVVPLSWAHRPFSTKRFLTQLVIHILFVGLPIALAISRLSQGIYPQG
jgi:hypothetical protein